LIKISSVQLFCLIMTFEIGSTTLFALGIGAKQDAWIVILLSTLIGFILLYVYTRIPKYYPNQNFGDILMDLLGKKLTIPLLFLFGLNFLSGASHNFYEFGIVIKLTALPKTPLLVILYLFIIVIVYILSLGFEVLARTAEILLPIFLIFLITTYILSLYSGLFDFSALQPVLGNGIRPVLEELYSVVGFPFGEMVLFLLFWHYLDDQQKIVKTAFIAVGLSAFLLTFTSVVMISVLGPEVTANAVIPILETILVINIGDIITNLDIIAVLLMFIGGFFKTSLHLYGFVLVLSWIFNTISQKLIMIIVGILFPIFVVYRFPGFDIQRVKGENLRVPLEIPLLSVLPILLLIIIVLKNKSTSRKENNNAGHLENTE
jgi:spore germination protein KB